MATKKTNSIPVADAAAILIDLSGVLFVDGTAVEIAGLDDAIAGAKADGKIVVFKGVTVGDTVIDQIVPVLSGSVIRVMCGVADEWSDMTIVSTGVPDQYQINLY